MPPSFLSLFFILRVIFSAEGSVRNFSFCNDAVEVWPRIWIGSYETALDCDWLRSDSVIVLVVNAAVETRETLEAIGCHDELNEILRFRIYYEHVGLVDGRSEDHRAVLYLLDDAAEQIRVVIAKPHHRDPSVYDDADVLVVCKAGRSRSVTVAIRYLQRFELMNYGSALAEIKKARPQAAPNPYFENLLKCAEESSELDECMTKKDYTIAMGF